MPKFKPKTITTVYSEDGEMAWTFIGRELVFMGNLWDFHPGCVGSTVGGYELTDWDGTRPHELAEELRRAMEAAGYAVAEVTEDFDSLEEAEDHMVAAFTYERSFSESPEERAAAEIEATLELLEERPEPPPPAPDDFAQRHDFTFLVDGVRWGAEAIGWTYYARDEAGDHEFEIEGEEGPPSRPLVEDIVRERLEGISRVPHGAFTHRSVEYDLRPNGEDYCWIYRDGKIFSSFSYWGSYGEAKVTEAIKRELALTD